MGQATVEPPAAGWACRLHRDPANEVTFVTRVLAAALKCPTGRAAELLRAARREGSAAVLIGTREACAALCVELSAHTLHATVERA